MRRLLLRDRRGRALEEERRQRHRHDEQRRADRDCELVALGQRGRVARAVGQQVVGAVDPAAVRSVLELRFLRMCAAYAIPRPLVNVRIGAGTPDFLWPEQRLVVETDGYDFHRTAAARRRDALKDEYLRGESLTVVRLTWADVTERPSATAAKVLAATSVA